jgi:hypothetical protein
MKSAISLLSIQVGTNRLSHQAFNLFRSRMAASWALILLAAMVATVPCLLALPVHGQTPQPAAPAQKKVAAKTVALMGTALNFGTVTAGTSSGRQVVVLTNTGTDPVSLSSVKATTNTPGAGLDDFSIESTSCSVPLQLKPKQSCNVLVLYLERPRAQFEFVYALRGRF